jgi:multidrug efflux pump subunit AcrA (membrane-fusion protein)
MKKKLIAIAAFVVAAGGVAVFLLFAANGQAAAPELNTITLAKGGIANSVSVKGIVESSASANIYSTLGYKIKSVDVKAGDAVTVGQALCRLDTEDLELNIAQQKAEAGAARKNAQNQLQSSERAYGEAVSNLADGVNAQVLSARNAAKTAGKNLESAQRNYDDKLRERQDGANAQIIAAQSALTAAQIDLSAKEEDSEKAAALYEIGGISKSECEQAQTAATLARNKYSDAATSVGTAQRALELELEQLRSSLDAASLNYANALAAEKSAEVAADQELEKYMNSVESSQIAADNDAQLIAIQKLEKQLEDSVVRATMDGTVTAVYAKVGAAGNGLLFVVEDIENLKIATKVKEYDSVKIAPGMAVEIKSDATGDAVYEGVLSSVAPTSAKNSAGEPASTTDVEFGAEIEVVSEGTPLKVGMNARLNIIMDKREGVYFVPYDAVAIGQNGESVVYAAAGGASGSYADSAAVAGGNGATVEVPVTTGLESDFYVEIMGEGLREGMEIVSDASALAAGGGRQRSGGLAMFGR